ncbi:hypothetical protein AXF42_Ash011376 [Apostasia shenzhenica]|uniref:DUF761 domain-containing protein n=1 Tax=Apostasia shenzhenica TaxID=1088818 RepID=A0A2I0AEG5_9ASPA|nr:hypothetical protein AXF42_Ash011376 [Apostasia shenzhenica]
MYPLPLRVLFTARFSRTSQYSGNPHPVPHRHPHRGSMKLRSPASAKRLSGYIRVVFFMMRKGLISKRKVVIMDVNLMMKRGNKLMGKALGNLVFHHHHHHRQAPLRRHGCGLQEYEFSCTTSPTPVFFHPKRSRHNYFPCLNTVDEEEDAVKVISPIPTAPSQQELSLLSSSVSSEDEEDRDGLYNDDDGAIEVDGDAEKFIKKFYNELRRQSRMALIQYEMDYEDMLARGS